MVENLQRENIHELDEAIGYRASMNLRPDFCTVETIAAQVAKSPAYIMVTCTLVPGLYCPGYSSAEALSKEASLMKAAARYKVDASRITAKITPELSRKRKGDRKRSEGNERFSK